MKTKLIATLENFKLWAEDEQLSPSISFEKFVEDYLWEQYDSEYDLPSRWHATLLHLIYSNKWEKKTFTEIGQLLTDTDLNQ